MKKDKLNGWLIKFSYCWAWKEAGDHIAYFWVPFEVSHQLMQINQELETGFIWTYGDTDPNSLLGWKAERADEFDYEVENVLL